MLFLNNTECNLIRAARVAHIQEVYSNVMKGIGIWVE